MPDPETATPSSPAAPATAEAASQDPSAVSPGPAGPAPIAITSDEADHTLRLLAVRLADYHWVTDERAVRPVGRHLDQSDSRHQNALVDAVAVTEVFVGGRLRAVDSSVSEDDVFTWAKREKAWRSKVGVELSDAGALWVRLNGYVQVRNAVQHGTGRLTDFQLGKWRTDNLAFIKSTGCHLDGDLIRIRRGDVDACFSVCAAFVAWLDTAATGTASKPDGGLQATSISTEQTAGGPE